MRSERLSRDEKGQLETLFIELGVLPGPGGQVIVNVDPQQRVSSVEVRAVLR